MSSTPKLFSTILWASDGRADEHQVVRYVGEFCNRYCCELRIAHVVRTILPEPLPQFELHDGEERAIAWLKAQTRALRLQGIEASLHVIRGVAGSPAPAIVQVAEAVDADLMVVHPHERRAVASIGTAARLLATAPCPVLSVRGALEPRRACDISTARGSPVSVKLAAAGSIGSSPGSVPVSDADGVRVPRT
jgi:nucleotide-binding universal stress UspA family protein